MLLDVYIDSPRPFQSLSITGSASGRSVNPFNPRLLCLGPKDWSDVARYWFEISWWRSPSRRLGIDPMSCDPLEYSETPIPIQRSPYGPERIKFVSSGRFRYSEVFNMEQSWSQALNNMYVERVLQGQTPFLIWRLRKTRLPSQC